MRYVGRDNSTPIETMRPSSVCLQPISMKKVAVMWRQIVLV